MVQSHRSCILVHCKMIHPSPANVLVGVSLDSDESRDLLSWAAKVLAQRGDTVVAFHAYEVKPDKRQDGRRRKGEDFNWEATKEHQKHVRRAKSFVVMLTGELVTACHAREVNLEARIGVNSSAGKGLIEEAKIMAADYLVIGSKSGLSNRSSRAISKYCSEHVPEGCSLILLNLSTGPEQNLNSKPDRIREEFDDHSNSQWSEKNSCTENSFSSEETEDSPDKNCERTSPRNAQTQSNTGEECLSTDQSFSTTNTSFSVAASKDKPQSKSSSSRFKFISSLLRASFDKSLVRKRSDDVSFNQEKLWSRCFSYEEIASATNNFHSENLVGRGGYSEVYRGVVEDGGLSIAVKCLTKENGIANKEKEFLMELGITGHVNHSNTTRLLGYCIQNGLYLIFNFCPNGTLSSALHGKTSKVLDWGMRYKVILGIAKGLHYLHKCCSHRIIHRDIKASNILLDSDFEPQISDFGLAKWLPSKWSHHDVMMPIEGTFGYLAPEYFMHGIVDEKTDVFAFGVLLLEIITGRKPIDSSKQSLLLWATPLMESGNLRELADPRMEGAYEKDQMQRVALTAACCVRQSSMWRPSMAEVMQLLTDGEEWKMPKWGTDGKLDDSVIFGFDIPSDLDLEAI